MFYKTLLLHLGLSDPNELNEVIGYREIHQEGEMPPFFATYCIGHILSA
jgi:hypothetical protein